MVSRVLRRKAVEDYTGEKKSALYGKCAAGLFPKPVKIGVRASGWPESEVAAVQAARIAGKSQDDIRALVRQLEAARTAA